MTDLPIILGSSSPFRRELLHKLGLPFTCESPDIDESRQATELPQDLVARLAKQKAQAIATRHPAALIIGSDQVAVLDDQILTKPGDHANAVAQLKAASGKEVTFYTGLCLLNSASDRARVIVEPFSVLFRTLTDAEIETYLQRERPYQCAGSFKSEGLGISLFKALRGEDPNSLIGLPLIKLIDLLKAEGVQVLA